MAADYYIRPMRDTDIADAERITADAYYQVDVALHRADRPAPTRRSRPRAELWVRRGAHLLTHDAGGCFVAEDASGVVGVSISLRRETMWILATFAVLPRLQGRGVGAQLLDAALAHGSGCLRGMLSASEDPRAVRRYLRAGFTMHPMMTLSGQVPRSVLPVVERVREGSASDIELMDSVDRRTRGSAHGVDHEFLTSIHRLVVVDRPTGAGYAYLEADGAPYLLAATNRRTAADLLWECLAATSPAEEVAFGHLTAVNDWAVDIGTEAGLHLGVSGFLALRGMKPPVPYIPSGHVL